MTPGKWTVSTNEESWPCDEEFDTKDLAIAAAADGKCTPPDWAVAMGHAEMWKLHNNCK